MPDSWSLFDFRQSISCDGEKMHHLGAFVRLVLAATVLSRLAMARAARGRHHCRSGRPASSAGYELPSWYFTRSPAA
jgi:hypothetical protein